MIKRVFYNKSFMESTSKTFSIITIRNKPFPSIVKKVGATLGKKVIHADCYTLLSNNAGSLSVIGGLSL